MVKLFIIPLVLMQSYSCLSASAYGKPKSEAIERSSYSTSYSAYPPIRQNPCEPSPCDLKSICKVRDEEAVCACKKGYIGKPPNCRRGCTESSQCTKTRSCINKKCRDPCPGTCGLNATCEVINHNPICSCSPDHTGDPFVSCQVISGPPQKESEDSTCLHSTTIVLGEEQICKEQLLFDNDIMDINWQRAHFIPSYPNYEFCSYQKRNDTFQINDFEWIIKPIPLKTNSDVRGILDLRNGCTSDRETDCIIHQEGGFILPPVMSERIKTTKSFKYGTVEIKAKLPVGDWIFPEIYLQSSLTPEKKIWIAYARGNEQLIDNGGKDLGGTVLYGGPIFNVSEPERSKYLSSIKAEKVFGSDYHTYSVVWEPKKISMSVDGDIYGQAEENISFFFDEPMHLVLGVGVGGVTDFPDNCVSKNNKKKPWVNFERLQMKKFFNAREDWLPTWTEDETCLKIEDVSIWAL